MSCQSRSDEISKDFKAVDNSLKKSSANIDSANAKLLKGLEDKLACPIKDEADDLFAFIQNTKKELGDYSSKKYPSKNGSEPALQDLETSNKIMIENGKAGLLFSKLKDLNQTALNCDSSKATATEIGKIFAPGFFKNSNRFSTLYFKDAPTVAALTILSSFQNKIKNIQLILLTAAAKHGQPPLKNK
jgi:hypothetical protein